MFEFFVGDACRHCMDVTELKCDTALVCCKDIHDDPESLSTHWANARRFERVVRHDKNIKKPLKLEASKYFGSNGDEYDGDGR